MAKKFRIFQVSEDQMLDALLARMVIHSFTNLKNFEIFAFSHEGQCYIAAHHQYFSYSSLSSFLEKAFLNTLSASEGQTLVQKILSPSWPENLSHIPSAYLAHRKVIRLRLQQASDALEEPLRSRLQERADLLDEAFLEIKKNHPTRVWKISEPMAPDVPFVRPKPVELDLLNEQIKDFEMHRTVVKKLKGSTSSKVRIQVVRELLGAECYRRLGNRYAEATLVEKGGELSLLKDYRDGDYLRFSSRGPTAQRVSQPLSQEENPQMARLALSALLLGDEDSFGLNEREAESRVGHNLLRGPEGLEGFDAGEAFVTPAKETVIGEYLEMRAASSFAEPTPFHFVSWINQRLPKGLTTDAASSIPELTFMDLSMTTEGEFQTEAGKKLWGFLQEKYANKEAEENRAWRLFLNAFESEASLKNYLQIVYRSACDYQEVPLPNTRDSSQAEQAKAKELREFKRDDPDKAEYLKCRQNNLLALHEMLKGITRQEWTTAMRGVYGRAGDLRHFLTYVDIPSRDLSPQHRAEYLQVLQSNNDMLKELYQKLSPGEDLPVIDESVSMPDRLYFRAHKAPMGQKPLAILPPGATSEPYETPVQSYLQRVLEDWWAEYEKQRGLGRKTLKPSFSTAALELKSSIEEKEVDSWVTLEKKIVNIFAQEIEAGRDPFNWKRLSNRMLWLFLMEAHYQREREIKQAKTLKSPSSSDEEESPVGVEESKGEESSPRELLSHATFEVDSLEQKIWNHLFSRPAATQSRMMAGGPPAASSQGDSSSRLQKMFSSTSAQRVAQAAEIFGQLRGNYAGLSQFLEGLRSEVIQWKLSHQSSFGIFRRIFGIRGIRQVLKQLNHKDSTPTEMLNHIQQILARNGKKEDTRELYGRLALTIQRNTGVQSLRGIESNHQADARSPDDSK